MTPRRRGMTLVEVLVAAGIGLVVVTAALSITVAASRAHARRVRLEALQRTATLVLDRLDDELRQAGLGVPAGSSAEGFGAFASRGLVLAEARAVGFLADLPRPDGTLASFSMLADVQPPQNPPGRLIITNEQSGTCEVVLSGGCVTGLTTRLFAPGKAGCQSDADHRTCPWGLARFRSGEWVLVVDGAGHWVERQVAGTVSFTSGLKRGLQLSSSVPAALLERARGGFTSSVDRVFYRSDGLGGIARHQCWDSMTETGPMPSLGPCPTGAGTTWELLAQAAAPSGFTFSYFDDRGVAMAAPVPTAQLSRIARVDIALRLEQRQGEDVLSFDSGRSVALRQ